MDPRTVYRRREEMQVLDVREGDEWVAGRIDGARHIPLAELPARVAELDAGRPVVAVCRSGHRSAAAAQYLARAGLSAHNMDGGLQQWAREGLPLQAPDGRPGRVL
jgi:rhodanese-related sulfurtransferase